MDGVQARPSWPRELVLPAYAHSGATAHPPAIGQGATVAAGATGGSAFGQGATVSGMNGTAIGVGAVAAFAGSTAIGAGAVTTAPNQMLFGTASSTYVAPGITSAASRAAQSGALQIVT